MRALHLGAAVLAATVGLARPASAQLNSAESSALLTAVMPEALTVALLPVATAFVLQGGSATNAATLPLVATTVWTVSLTRTNVSLYGYFSNAGTALVHTDVTNTVDIPSSRVGVSVNGGALVAFDQTVPFGAASAGRQLFSQAVTVANATGVRIDTLALNIDLNGYVLPADIYTGTLRVRAQATP